VLFLGGLGRSGTTVLERALGALPGVCPLGEVTHLWRRDLVANERCGCGSRFDACEFWQLVGKHAFDGWHTIDLARVLRLQETVERTRHIPRLATARPGPDGPVAEYADLYARIYRAAAEITGASVVVDSSKHSALAYCLRWATGVEVRVAHVVRDARGVAYSWTKTVTRPESDGREEMTRYSPTRAALLWTGHNAAFGLLGTRGVPVRRFRYEEFIADPRATLRAVAAFAGLDLHTHALDFLTEDDDTVHADLPVIHSAAGNPMRFVTGKVPLRRDEAWREALPAAQRRLVGAIAAPLLGAYGYPLRGRLP
jgi:hypothetical protein